MTKFSYWVDERRKLPLSYRRTNGALYQQLKPQNYWGASDPEWFVDSIQIPDTAVLLVGAPL